MQTSIEGIKIEPKIEPNVEPEVIQEVKKKKNFTCHICQLYARYDYFGRKPLERHIIDTKPDTKRESVILLEPCYVTDDPFSFQNSNNYLILGADCSICGQMTCVSNRCSFFYYRKRFCFKCASQPGYQNEFPEEIKIEIEKFILTQKK